jgi:2-oxoglutarate dehydrogenase complex dehydrogenase (E1) component-like enzyme
MRRVINRHNRTLYLEYAGRDASASPAAGYMALHLEQLERLTQAAAPAALVEQALIEPVGTDHSAE